MSVAPTGGGGRLTGNLRLILPYDPDMITALKSFFENRIAGRDAATAEEQEHALQLATAALLVEVMRSDFDASRQERRAIKQMLSKRFDIAGDEVERLVELAEQEVEEAVSLFQFTQLVDRSFDYDQKLRIMEMLWRVVYVDGHKDKHEEYLLRKISDLIHVSHKDFIRTRHIVEQDDD